MNIRIRLLLPALLGLFALTLLVPVAALAGDGGLFLAPLFGSADAVSAASSYGSSAKILSSNYTLVNVAPSTNQVQVHYYQPNGTQWRSSETMTLHTQGAQIIRRQYDDTMLASHSGSAVVAATAELGAVGQIQARGQTPSSGAYSAPTRGTGSINVPLVMKGVKTQSGSANSQVVVQNTSNSATTFVIKLFDAKGSPVYTSAPATLNSGAFFMYDVRDDAAMPDGVYSAVVAVQTAGTIWANSNLFIGSHSLQTFNGFSTSAQTWMVPLFASRLGNGLSTPISVQNLSSTTIPVGGIKLTCKADPTSGKTGFSTSNTSPVGQHSSYFLNPVTDTTIPANWYGACSIDTSGYASVTFVQMRFLGSDRAAAFEAFPGNSGKAKVIVPIFMKRLSNGFATAVTIQNLGTASASVNIAYQAGNGAPAGCSVNVGPFTVASGESLIQNHRVASGPNSVPVLPDNCFGSMVITSNGQPIQAFVQIDDLDQSTGDPFMAHNAFPAD